MISFLTPVVSNIESLLSKDQYGTWTSLTVPNLVAGILKLALILIVVIFFVQFIHGAANWMISAGNAEQLQKAQKELTSALIGLVIVFSAWAILNLVNYFFGLSGMGAGAPAASGQPAAQNKNCLDTCKETSCQGFASFCYKDCRCICSAQGEMWYYDNPWLDADGKTYVCRNGARVKK